MTKRRSGLRSAGVLAFGAWSLLAAGCGGGEEPPDEPAPAEPPSQEAEVPPGAIRVYYDELAAPHVFADTDAGVFYGLGYTQVRDFPVATLSNLWSTTGRFAEVAGPRVLARDLRVRVFGLDEVARRQMEDAERLDARVRTLLEAYVAGVNAGREHWLGRPEMIGALVGENGELWIDPVPPWMNPTYTGEDPRAILRRLFEAEVGLFHVLTLGVGLNAGNEFFGGGYVLGTNVWLARNPAGRPGMLALMDAHQPIKRDGLRSYPVQLHGPSYRMAGITMPGYPCVFSGFSESLFYGLSTPPKTPGPVLDGGLPFRLNERVPQTTMRWRARLEEGGPPRIRVDGEDVMPLEEHEVLLRCFDAESGEVVDDPTGVRTFYRVPPVEGELAGLSVGHPVAEPAPGVRIDPDVHREIVFEGRSFLSSRNAIETFVNLAYSERTGGEEGGLDRVLERARLSFGRAELLVAGDVGGGMEYVFMTHAPRPGEKAREARSWIGDPLLDGRDSGFRWRGFHELTELPRLLRPAGYDEKNEVWLNCNTSPHHVRGPGAPAYAFDGPPWLYDDEAWKTLRHDRARELFDRLGPEAVIGLDDVQRIALDTQDTWIARMWPWLAAMREDPTLGLNARDLLEWIEDQRFVGAGGGEGADPFLAERESRIMPYVTLLMGRFEDRIAELWEPKAHEVAFAYDPSGELPKPETFLKSEEWRRTRRTLRDVLNEVGALWVATRDGTEGGIVTQRYLAKHAGCDSVVASPWRGAEAVEESPELRWGDVNFYLMTPHVLPKPNPVAREAWLLSLFEPCFFEHLPEYYRGQRSAFASVRGTRTSIFHAHSQSLWGTDEKLFPTKEGLVYAVPVDFGSQVMFAVELRPGERARVRMLPAMGATEILVGLEGNGTGAGDHFLPFRRFLEGEWSEFVLEEEELKGGSRRWYFVVGGG